MKENIQFVILQRVDLMTANPPMVYSQALELHNHAAHEWRVQVVANSQPVDLTGCAVACYAARGDKKTVYIKGAVSGSVASVVFDSAFYAINGELAARMELSGSDGRVLAVARLLCTVSQTGTDMIVDPTGEIPSLDELLAELGVMRETTQAAQEAADAANEAAGRAPYIDGTTGTWFVWDNDKGIYVDTGNVAAGKKGAPGKDGVTPHIGENGNWFVGNSDTGTPARGPQGANGDGAGTVTGVKIGDTVYEPDDTGVVVIGSAGGSSLPAGGTSGQILAKKTDADGDAAWVDPPEGTMKSVCGKEADESGNVDLGASDVGAVSIPNEDDPTYGAATGINADMLGGVAASEYAKKSEIPDAATGLPAGGSAGQVLTKNSDADDDAGWADPPEADEVDWDSINNKPTTFTPSAHTHDPVIATADTLGCVKVGDGLSVAADGTISAMNFKIIRNITMTYFTVIGGYSSGALEGITSDNVVIAGELISGDNVSAYITFLHVSGGTIMMNAKNREDNSDCTLETLTLDFVLYI